jgi:hypothetical protein
MPLVALCEVFFGRLLLSSCSNSMTKLSVQSTDHVDWYAAEPPLPFLLSIRIFPELSEMPHFDFPDLEYVRDSVSDQSESSRVPSLPSSFRRSA